MKESNAKMDPTERVEMLLQQIAEERDKLPPRFKGIRFVVQGEANPLVRAVNEVSAERRRLAQQASAERHVEKDAAESGDTN